MPSANSVRRNIIGSSNRPNGFIALAIIGGLCFLSSLETAVVVALSTTSRNPNTVVVTKATADVLPTTTPDNADEHRSVSEFSDEESPISTTSPKSNFPATADDSSSSSTTAAIATPNDRAELLNEHLRRELSDLSNNEKSVRDDIGSAFVREAAAAMMLSSDDGNNSDPPRFLFGRPSLKAYRSFVHSDRYSTDPRLLDGSARKAAKRIRNMIKQRVYYLERGIASPPKHHATPLQDDDDNDNKNLQQQPLPPRHFREKIANSIAKGERRARARSNQNLRTLCGGCRRPFDLCLCPVLKNPETSEIASRGLAQTEVVVLQHPNEFRKKHTSTVPLLRLLLGTENVRIKVGYEFTMKDIIKRNSNNNNNGDDETDERPPIMLFPGPDAIDLDEYYLAATTTTTTTRVRRPQETQQQHDNADHRKIDDNNNPGDNDNSLPSATNPNDTKKKRHTLVLIDGTWFEAKRMIKKSPEILKGCQMVQFAFGDDDEEEEEEEANAAKKKSRSLYHAMRREPEEHYLSTLEACGEALRVLEGPVHGPRLREALLGVLSKHVELHLKNAREIANTRRKRDTTSRDSKLKRAKEIERAMYGGDYHRNDAEDDDGSNNNSNGNSVGSDLNERSGDRALEIQPATATTTTIADTPTRVLAIDRTTNVTVRRLTHEDIPTIDAWWENGGTAKSITTITRSLDADYRLGIGASLGIIDDGQHELVACVLRYESGPLGILHVVPEHRGKGYGTALVREALGAMVLFEEANNSNLDADPPTALIKDGNTVSERVFSKAGFVRENPDAKKGTGKRRANRKWIYNICSTPIEGS